MHAGAKEVPAQSPNSPLIADHNALCLVEVRGNTVTKTFAWEAMKGICLELRVESTMIIVRS